MPPLLTAGSARSAQAAQRPLAPADAPQRLRVAHVLPFPGVGGTEHATLRLALAARAHGVESVALCPAGADDVHAHFRAAGIGTAAWHPRDDGGGSAPAKAARALRLAWILRRQRVDVVHCADVAAVRRELVVAARLGGAPLVCHVRNRNARLPWWIEDNLDAVRRFVFVSQASWRAFAHEVAPERGCVLYDGVEVPELADLAAARRAAGAAVRRELGLALDTPLVGMVARVEPQKDFATLAGAIARVAAELPDVRVLVVGGTDRTPAQRAHFPQVQRAVREAGLERHVLFLGLRDDVPRLLRALDVSVLSTHWEGLPLVLWEAMAEGTPVVATAVDGVPEAIEHGATGLLVQHEDAVGLADALLGLLRDPERARRLGEAGRAHARARFSTAAFGAQAAELYRVVLARPVRGAPGAPTARA